MDIFDSEGSVRHDITEAVEAIFRYIEKCPYKEIYPVPPPDSWGTIPSCPDYRNVSIQSGIAAKKPLQ